MSRSANAERLVPCMPPLMNEEKKVMVGSNYSGKTCENIVKSYFLFQGINVSEPYVDDGVDILIEKKFSIWKRGQIKKIVYKSQLDHKLKKKGIEIYRDQFYFNFQSGKDGERKQRSAKDFDYFYHVLKTPLRTLIWEIPTDIITLNSKGNFVSTSNPVIDRDSWVRSKRAIDYNRYLIHAQYDSLIFKTHSEFFLTQDTTLDKFFIA
jgi:hypothetical protein